MLDITPTNQQNDGLNAIANWYRHGSKRFFYLGGYAGAGKTVLARLAVAACGLDPDSSQVAYGSFTGKAAMVMRRKGMDSRTIHQHIYVLAEHHIDGTMKFVINRESPIRFAKLIVLDECSMINELIATDLLRYGVKVLVLGDPGQLPPVNGTGYFTGGKPDFFLSEIHRQALENPIIRISMDVRNNKPIPMGDHGAVKKLRFEDYSDQELLQLDQVITGKHTSRWSLNQHMLATSGYDPSDYPLMPGIKVMCLRNYHQQGLFNGLIGKTINMVDRCDIHDGERYFKQSVNVEDGGTDDCWATPPMRMNMGAFEDNWGAYTDDNKALDIKIGRDTWNDDEARQYMWDMAYAITVHKSQGSQWDHVGLFDDGHLSWLPAERKKWLYTAITRAAHTLTVLV